MKNNYYKRDTLPRVLYKAYYVFITIYGQAVTGNDELM